VACVSGGGGDERRQLHRDEKIGEKMFFYPV
jgi:hypothetical protein